MSEPIFPPEGMPDLPESVVNAAEFAPVEDVLLPIIRHHLPGARIYSEVPADDLFPYAVVRVAPSERWWTGDDRFVDWATVFVHVFAKNPDGERKAAIFSDAIRVALRDAWMQQTSFGMGHISQYRMTNRPSRRSDWATSQGPVQYADLPNGVTRYEALYAIQIRRPV